VTAPEAPRFRFGPLDRSGWILGLGAVPCAILGVGFLVAALVLHLTAAPLVAAVPVGLAALLAVGRHDGRALHEWGAPVSGWLLLHLRGDDRWAVPVPFVGRRAIRASLPPFLAGLELADAIGVGPPRPGGIGVVFDRSRQLATAAFRVRGGAFALLEADDRARVLDGWGSALAGFCRERTPVTRVGWTEWAAPASLDEHLTFVREQRRHPSDAAGLHDYLELVARAGPLTTAHETVLTVTVDARRASSRDPSAAGTLPVDALLEALRLFASRLEHAGLVVEPPLGPAELALILRLRSDPSAASRLAVRRDRLADRTRLVAPHNVGPVAVEAHWHHVRVDQAVHRCYWIAEWPRLEVPGDWLSTLLLHPGGIRTISLVHEPVPPSRSRRAVDREATRLASDEEERGRRGFRIRAQHRRAQSEVLAREQELVAGYAELRFAGFLVVTAFDAATLRDQARDWEQVAAQCGLELRALDGQHDLALAAALPLGRVPAGHGRA
jgi:hypothetical protein